MIKVLIVDDEESVCRTFQAILRKEGYEVYTAMTGNEAMSIVYGSDIDLIFTDLRLPDLSGINVLVGAKHRVPSPEVILMTGFASIETAVDAIKRGAHDYLIKPISPDKLKITALRAIEKILLTKRINALSREITDIYSFESIIGRSAKMVEVFKKIRFAARSDSSVVVTGESGTGKELVARAVHYNSPRKDNPFVAVNCGAIAKELVDSELFGHARGSFTGAVRDRIGFLEQASAGTLFLDEIGETTPDFQVKLLRVLQEGEYNRVGDSQVRKVDIRVIAATNRDLKKAMANGTFREDLYYRLNVLSIALPSLRERKEDIPLLAFHFLKKHGQNKTGAEQKEKYFTPEALDALVHYEFPGNVRELENAVEQAVVFTQGNRITRQELPFVISSDEGTWMPRMDVKPLKAAKREFERSFITSVLAQSKGNISKAAKVLDIHRQSLQQKLKELGIATETQKEGEDP